MHCYTQGDIPQNGIQSSPLSPTPAEGDAPFRNVRFKENTSSYFVL